MNDFRMEDFLTFRRYITPVFIQIIFWIGILGIVIVAINQITSDFGSDTTGVLFLIFGPIFWRVYCELLILLFRMNENVVHIRRSTAALAGEELPPPEPPAVPAWPAPAPMPAAPPVVEPPVEEPPVEEQPVVEQPASPTMSELQAFAPPPEPPAADPQIGPEHEVAAIYPQQRFCRQCGAGNAAANRFCESCGKPLQG